MDVTYYLFGEDGCEYKAKVAPHVRTHKAFVHDIDITYYLCGEDGCEYKAKGVGSVKQHKAYIP